MNVPIFALDAIESSVDIRAATERVLAGGRYILGPEVERFEAAYAAYCGTRRCVGVASGTDALEIALRALDVGPGDEVVTVANAGPYAGAAIRAAGASPRYVDVDEATLLMSPDHLRAVLEESSVAAVIVTHLYGQLAEVEAIAAIADAAGVPLIEDSAQAHGARRAGRRAGSFGRVGCFSFYPTKNLGAIGDGGAITTDDEELAESIRSLRQYGWESKYHTQLAGGRNSRLDELQAAVLSDKLPHLDSWNDERRAIAARYREALTGLPLLLPPPVDESTVAHLFVVRCEERDELLGHLAEAGVGTDVHYPVADHLQPAYPSAAPEPLPVTEAACERVISLPCYPGLTLEAQVHVVDSVRSFFGQGA